MTYGGTDYNLPHRQGWQDHRGGQWRPRPGLRELVKETVEKLGVELSVELKPEYFDQAEEKEQEKNRF